MTDDEKKVRDALVGAFKEKIPSGRSIAVKAVAKALAGHESDANWIKEHFGILVEKVQIAAYETYLAEEKIAGSEALVEVFRTKIQSGDSPVRAAQHVARYFTSLDRFFLSLTQGRRPRAGNTFEYLLRELFTKLKYPFTPQPIINGQPDFVMPSLEHFQKNAPDSIIFTVKRTLRERWRQIVTEGTRGLAFSWQPLTRAWRCETWGRCFDPESISLYHSESKPTVMTTNGHQMS